MPGLMSREPDEPRRAPRHPVFAENAPPDLFIGELCDRCGAVPRFHVPVPLADGRIGGLYFCTHHYEKLLPALGTAGLKP